jgi:hypothetical protein
MQCNLAIFKLHYLQASISACRKTAICNLLDAEAPPVAYLFSTFLSNADLGVDKNIYKLKKSLFKELIVIIKKKL